MARHPELLSAVWREACRHIEIDEAAATLAATIARHIPLRALVVMRVNASARRIETIAHAVTRPPFPPVRPAIDMQPGPWRRIAAWLRARRVSDIRDPEVAPWIGGIVPCDGDALVGPLPCGGAPGGILLLAAPPKASFQAADRKTVADLLEPFAVALENDDRLHELRSLREAAEADRETLLSRLGRRNISEEIVGVHTGLRHVMERVDLVARSDVPVLILGETGTGKEVVARAIHDRSARSEGPFIRVNCGAIPPELVDSQLFGHEKGSFTGAAEQHHGWFERADRGTLFLDEIGELPLPAQVRLLRVLQDHQIERVGGRSPIHVDVRIVAATHRDLATMVKEGSFREDLWYRVNVFPVLLPRLRERTEDIPALVRHFAHRAAARFGLPRIDPTPEDLGLLAAYDWPGNIRELGAVIDRAAILGGGRCLNVAAALGIDGARGPARPGAERGSGPRTTLPSGSTGDPVIEPLADAMRRHIERALEATGGRVEGRRGAARLLDINPHTLRARMRKLGISPSGFRP